MWVCGGGKGGQKWCMLCVSLLKGRLHGHFSTQDIFQPFYARPQLLHVCVCVGVGGLGGRGKGVDV